MIKSYICEHCSQKCRGENKPVVLDCSHILCLQCVTEIMKEANDKGKVQFECPIDKKRLLLVNPRELREPSDPYFQENKTYQQTEQRKIAVILTGKTGAGKSTLAAKISQDPILFKIGHTSFSETMNPVQKTFFYKGIELTVIDLMGFGDNRPGATPSGMIIKLAKQTYSMKNGINIGLFCLPSYVKGLTQHDLDEIRQLLRLVGDGFLTHLYFVRTHLRQNENQEEATEGIFQILTSNGFKGFNSEVLTANLNDNLNGFMKQFDQLLEKNIPNYMPEIAKDLDPEDPVSIEMFMSSPCVKLLFKDKEEQLQQAMAIKEALENQYLKLKYDMEEQSKDIEVTKAQLQKVKFDNTKLAQELQNTLNRMLTLQHETEMRIKTEVAQAVAVEREKLQQWQAKQQAIYTEPELEEELEEEKEPEKPKKSQPKPQPPPSKPKKKKNKFLKIVGNIIKALVK